jgi:hypothetical protein
MRDDFFTSLLREAFTVFMVLIIAMIVIPLVAYKIAGDLIGERVKSECLK